MQTDKRKKLTVKKFGHQGTKLLLFGDDMAVYLENLRELTKKLLLAKR
jgi:hypothetical protein